MSRPLFQRSKAHWARIGITAVVTSVVALSSCSPGASKIVDPGPTETSVFIRTDLSGTQVATVVVDVTGSDIPATLVFNIPIISGIAAGTVTLPTGSNRTIKVRAYDAGGVETHEGLVTLNIQPGTNPTISIVLASLTGDLPITATLGGHRVTVTPGSASLALASSDTVRLAAAIVDSKGLPDTGVVAWATHDPGIAVVNASGLVNAVGVGTTTVSAVFQGVTGIATITVTP